MDKTKNRSTTLIRTGRRPENYSGAVNPPIYRTTTFLYENMAEFLDPETKFRYGREGTPLSHAFEEALSELEGGYNAISTCSGLSAITTAMAAFIKSGDHILITDNCYPPLRSYCERRLKPFGIEVEYYDPMIGGAIEELIRDNTALIYLESPGSITFEVQDIPSIVQVAGQYNITTVMDNTWSAGILFRPIEHGVNIALQSAAKYLGGHSDVNLGVAVADNAQNYQKLKEAALDLGLCAGAEDLYLSLRGLRTLEMRIRYAGQAALPIIEWFRGRKEVQDIYGPLLENAAGHDVWQRDFTGHNGLFSVLFHPRYDQEFIAKFIDHLELFSLGSGWGGYESLIRPQDMKDCRTNWDKEGILVRFQIGHEDTQDLIADLEHSIDKINP